MSCQMLDQAAVGLQLEPIGRRLSIKAQARRGCHEHALHAVAIEVREQGEVGQVEARQQRGRIADFVAHYLLLSGLEMIACPGIPCAILGLPAGARHEDGEEGGGPALCACIRVPICCPVLEGSRLRTGITVAGERMDGPFFAIARLWIVHGHRAEQQQVGRQGNLRLLNGVPDSRPFCIFAELGLVIRRSVQQVAADVYQRSDDDIISRPASITLMVGEA